MLEKKLSNHNLCPGSLEKMYKNISLLFESTNKQKIEKIILRGVDLALTKEPTENKLENFYQEIFTKDSNFSDFDFDELKYLVYQLLEAAEKHNFWSYRLLIKLINKLDYLKNSDLEVELKEEFKDYFLIQLSELESDLFLLKQDHKSELATIVDLILKFWEQDRKNWEQEDLLLIKLQLIELGLKPQQKIKIKSFYKYLNQNSDLCSKFTSKISKEKYLDYELKDIPFVAGLLELEKLLNNDHYLCEAIVNKINGLGIDYNQEEFNLEILADCLAKNANFDLEQELELFNFIVELLTDLATVSIIREKEENGQKLIEAIKKEDFVRAEELIDSKIKVNIKDDNGKTPLIWAAEKENDELMLKLMKAGAKLDATDNQGRTVLSHIHNCYQMEVMQRLNNNN